MKLLKSFAGLQNLESNNTWAEAGKYHQVAPNNSQDPDGEVSWKYGRQESPAAG